MCEYCNPELMDDGDNKKLVYKDFDGGILGKIDCMVDVFAPEDRPPIIDMSFGEMDVEIPINYCPMCGRKLREVEE